MNPRPFGFICVCVSQIGCIPDVANAIYSHASETDGSTGGGPRPEVREQDWNGIFAVADAVATPHKMQNVNSASALAAHFNRQSMALKSLNNVEPSLAPLCAEIQSAHQAAAVGLQQLKEIDAKIAQNKREAVKRIFGAIVEANKPEEERSIRPAFGVGLSIGKGVKLSDARAELISKLRQHEYDLRSTISSLFPLIRTTADKYDRATTPCSLDVSYYPAWHGAYGAETLAIKNSGNEAIENGILLIDLIDDQGKHAQHLHTVDALGPGDSLSLTYGYWSTDFYFGATRDNVRKINVSLVSLRQAGEAKWSFTQGEHDARVKKYCQNLEFRGSYLPPKKAGFFTSSKDPGFSFKFSGLDRLQVNRVEITFQGDFGTTTAAGEEQGYMTANKLVEKRSKGFPRQKPKQVSLRLGFRDTSYVHEVTWPIE